MNEQYGQTEKSDFFNSLDTCCQQIALKVGKEDILTWKNSDYIKLSALLYRETKITISENTLKRIFGKLKTSTRYYPQKATRDALAQFIGHRDWYEFELLQNSQLAPQNTNQYKKKQHVTQPDSKKKNRLAFYIITGVAVVSAITFFVFFKNQNELVGVQLLCLNPEGKTPHSAIFKLESEGILDDDHPNFSIGFDDGRSRTSFKDSLLNHYYDNPGRYFPVLYHRDRPIDTAIVYLRSEGWSAIASMQTDTTRVYPILNNKVLDLNSPTFSLMDVYRAGVDTTKTFFLEYANIKPSAIKADNLEFHTYVETSGNRPGVRCSQVNIVIYGEYGYHYFIITKPECVAWSRCKFSDNIREGVKDDLRQLGHDLSKGGSLKLRILNKNVQLFVNDTLSMKTSYRKPIGNLMGIKIIFAGVGRFSDLDVIDLKTKQHYLIDKI